METELVAVATAAATSLVNLVVSEAWEWGRTRLPGLLRRRGADDAGEELRREGGQLAAARSAGDEEAEALVRDAWRDRVQDILTTDPARGEELLRLLAELDPGSAPVLMNFVSGGINYGPAFQGSVINGGITFQVQAPGPAGARLRPDQVPAVTSRFVNRSADLALLDDSLDMSERVVAVRVVRGMTGIGKSALVRWWAHKERARFPDGQLYVDFGYRRGTAPVTGSDVSEALAMVLRGLHVTDAFMPASLEERMSLLRTLTASWCGLIVLEGVSEPAQVRPFVPKGPGSALLVTSHRRLGELALDGARLIDVKPLDRHGGLALLSDLCGPHAVEADPDTAGRLVHLCSGMPVALRIAAARLHAEDGMTLTDLVAELEDESGRLAGLSLEEGELSMSAVLGPSYRMLGPGAARLYRVLGLLPAGPVDAAVAAAAAGIATAEAQRLLRVLADAHLVEKTPDKRFQMPDLVRLHARERAEQEEAPGEDTAVIRRTTEHFLALTAFADRAVQRDRLRIADLTELLERAADPFAAAGGPDPVAWLDAERFMILAVLHEAARHELHGLVWPLAEAFTILFLNRRHLGMWRESSELGVAAAVAAGRSAVTAEDVAKTAAAEARLRSVLSRPLMDLEQYDRAGAELETAVARAAVSGNLALQASVQEFLGRCLSRTDPAQAAEAYQRSLQLNTRAGQRRGAAIARFFLGAVQDDRGDHAQALATLGQARAELLDGDKPDERMAARVTAALGAAHAHLGDTATAVTELSAAVDTLNRVGAHHYEAQALQQLADLAVEAGDVARARQWLTRALDIHTANGSPEAAVLRDRLDELDEPDDEA